MSKPRLLDLFCGAGGAAMGYYRAGFDVVGVDIKPQPNYPFEFHEADAMEYPLDGFDLVHASPPCQQFSITRAIHRWEDEYPDLIEPISRRFIEAGKPWVIENVPGSPMPGPIFCGTTFGLRVYRHRRFWSDKLFLSPGCRSHSETTGSHRGYSVNTPMITVAGHNFNREQGAAAMGIDWPMTREELAEAIPPAYTEFIGRQLMQAITPRAFAATGD